MRGFSRHSIFYVASLCNQLLHPTFNVSSLSTGVSSPSEDKKIVAKANSDHWLPVHCIISF